MTPSYGGTGEPRSTDAGAMAASEAAGENAVSEYAIGQETAAAEEDADRLIADKD